MSQRSRTESRCRFCGATLRTTVVDLGLQPLANSYPGAADLVRMEPFFPLHVCVCGECWLVQLEDSVSPKRIFSDYAYFSSYSESWLRHAAAFADMIVGRFGYGPDARVIEVGSNDGYLLQYFARLGIPVLGVEPAANVAEVAVAKGIPTIVRFFGRRTARELVAQGQSADLLVGNNVLAHVPDINDFVAGLRILLKPRGVITMEFPHVLRLIAGNQFDTVYHEHYSYLSFTTVRRVFRAHRLDIFDVEELPTHGGSLRIYARHEDDGSKPVGPRVAELVAREEAQGMIDLAYYEAFGERVKETKRKLLRFLIHAKEAGKTIVGYGAPAKGSTLLNYCGIRSDFLEYTVDRSPHKQGRYLPGTHIPIHHPEKVRETKPDYLLILPWNLRDEITEQMSHIREWKGQFVVPIPEIEVY